MVHDTGDKVAVVIPMVRVLDAGVDVMDACCLCASLSFSFIGVEINREVS